MGRAIDMEKDIDELKAKVKKLEDALGTIVSSVGDMEEKSSKVTHVDLVDETKKEEKSGGKKTNNKTASGASKRSSDGASADKAKTR